MGGGISLQDNQEVSHQSGGSRLGESFVKAFCVAPLLILGMCFLVGWNEKRAVCDSRAIDAGRDNVNIVGCDDASASVGELVMASCNIQRRGLPTFSGGGDFASLSYTGTGLRTDASMYLCVESSSSQTTKDSVGGGTTTVTTYTYSLEWRSSWVDSSTFAKRQSDNFIRSCGADNPPWPDALPQSGSKYAPTIEVGPFTTSLASSVPLDTPITNWQPPTAAWDKTGSAFTSSNWRVNDKGLGNVRVVFYGNDWSNPMATILGLNDNGRITRWTAPNSWLCSGSGLLDLRMGAYSKDELFDALKGEAAALTWVLRIVGFIVMWVAFCMCCAPLGVIADCVPFIGPYIGDGVETLACCIACPPACACCLGVAGVMWVAMRPLVGIPLLLFWVFVMCGFAYFLGQKRDWIDRLMGNKATPLTVAASALIYGAVVPKFCPDCGTATAGAKFCTNCGKNLTPSGV
mmetsp:Transcript_50925/g.142504  ORF Transcript_50925/g.142504 Transcript_50925/m.142504 type:complete len:461 (-) Transcript_50925:284-1666(-)